MGKVSMKERVRMVPGTLVLMNVQKRRLQKRQRQHEIHHYGNQTPHTDIVAFYSPELHSVLHD